MLIDILTGQAVRGIPEFHRGDHSPAPNWQRWTIFWLEFRLRDCRYFGVSGCVRLWRQLAWLYRSIGDERSACVYIWMIARTTEPPDSDHLTTLQAHIKQLEATK
ncbi:MAG: hypothetical protein ACTHMR_21570 [Thermomicrobiales bacterium]